MLLGVQKGGTGELQTWLASHPQVHVHGGEVHYFDRFVSRAEASRVVRCRDRDAAALRYRYMRHLWGGRRGRRALKRSQLEARRYVFEKTPAYFDTIDPALAACAVPSARLLVMLREPVARAVSGYRMCQVDKHKDWCARPLDEAVATMLGDDSGAAPRLNRSAVLAEPEVARMLRMGFYAAHLLRWLVHYPPASMRVLWLEHFKADPFGCMGALEAFLGVSRVDWHRLATRNAAGLWVVGPSKSSARRRKPSVAVETLGRLERLYARWHAPLVSLINSQQLALLPNATVPRYKPRRAT